MRKQQKEVWIWKD